MKHSISINFWPKRPTNLSHNGPNSKQSTDLPSPPETKFSFLTCQERQGQEQVRDGRRRHGCLSGPVGEAVSRSVPVLSRSVPLLCCFPYFPSYPAPSHWQLKIKLDGMGVVVELRGAPDRSTERAQSSSPPWCCPLAASGYIRREHKF